jgi:hypothetical protein
MHNVAPELALPILVSRQTIGSIEMLVQLREDSQ